MQVPRTIYSLWLQGIAYAPPLAKLNFERWARLNPGYRLVILDEADVRKMLSRFALPFEELTPQALSDVVRAFLLSRSGGIWVDATLFPVVPLDEWLPSYVTSRGFFAFERPGIDRPISSWFLAATPGNRIMRAWWKEVIKYWAVPRKLKEGIPHDPVGAVTDWADAYPYFWFHYLFQLLIETDAEFSTAWAECVKVPMDPTITIQNRFAQEPKPTLEEIASIVSSAPVQKLNWRLPHSIELLSAID